MNLFKLWGEIGVRNQDAIQAIDDTTDAAQGAENTMSSAFKKIGTAVAGAFAVDKIISFGKDIVNTAATVDAEASAFGQIMGDYSDQARGKLSAVADATGVMETRMQGYFTSLSAKFKGLGFDVEEATSYAARGLTLASDAAAFWDVSLDDASSHLNSFINGSYEGGEAIGLFANDTQMAMYAVQQGIVESTTAWSSLDEATKQATRLEYAENMYAQSGATGQAAREADQYANVQANLNEKWRQFKAEIGAPILQNIVIPAMEALSSLVDKASIAFQNLSTWVSQNQGFLTALGAAIGIVTLALTIQAAVQGVKAAMNAAEVTSLGALIAAKWADAAATMAALAPYLLIAAAIAAVITVIVLLAKNWDKVKETAANVWAAVVAAWSSAAEWINSNVVTPIVSFFTSLWGSIQSIWNSITSSLQTAWDAIVNVVTVAIMLIGSILQAAFDIITLPFRFIWENCKDTVITVWEAIKSAVSTAIEAVRTVIVAVWTAISTTLSPILEGIKTAVTTAWEAIKIAVSIAVNAVKTTVSTVWNAIKTAVSTAVNAIKIAVTAGFNAIKAAISPPLNAAKAVVSNIFNGIKTTISNVINGAKTVVQNGLNAIKGFFNKLKLKFPSIKLPHFSITGSFSLSPPSVPKLSVSWYAKGGIMNQPTLFDFNPKTGHAKVGGEAGAEAIAPIDTLLGYVRTAVQEENSNLNYNLEKLISMLAEYFPELMSRQLVLDTGVLVGELAPSFDNKLGDINGLRKRGR